QPTSARASPESIPGQKKPTSAPAIAQRRSRRCASRRAVGPASAVGAARVMALRGDAGGSWSRTQGGGREAGKDNPRMHPTALLEAQTELVHRVLRFEH